MGDWYLALVAKEIQTFNLGDDELVAWHDDPQVQVFGESGSMQDLISISQVLKSRGYPDNYGK